MHGCSIMIAVNGGDALWYGIHQFATLSRNKKIRREVRTSFCNFLPSDTPECFGESVNLGPRKLFSLLFAPLFSSVRVWEKDDETKIHLPPPPPPSIDAIPSTEQQEEEEGADCVGIQGIQKK